MREAEYLAVIENREDNHLFEYKLNSKGQLTVLKNKADPYQMNWLNGKEIWGRVDAPDVLNVCVDRHFTKEGRMRETYTFKNDTEFDVFIQRNEIGIYTTFPDDYKAADICMRERCHVHVWCGKNTTYLYGLRMGGEAPHLGLVLNQGSIDGYSILRNPDAASNDRGCIILHPEKCQLKPGESMSISWDFVWFDALEQFFAIVDTYPNMIRIQIDHPIAFEGEETELLITGAENVIVSQNGKPVLADVQEKGSVSVKEEAAQCGEKNWEISSGGCNTIARTLVLPKIEILAERRCRYIVEKQQYREPGSHLDGAFLIYDTEEESQYYSHEHDYNAGRERVGMGVLLAKYLQNKQDEKLERGLKRYTEYIYRELYDEDTGTVFNDMNRNREWHRLYNYPWMAVFFMERFYLYGEKKDLEQMYCIMKAYYQNNGIKFYAIGIPVRESVQLLRENGMQTEAEDLLQCYRRHGDYILESSLNYPAHEVNYEQSIVAPAVSILLQVYQLTNEQRYLDEAKKQLRVLELFNGQQPDYHLYESAIRHWDGYWFGKKKMYGDTFPHYWSALTGNVFALYGEITDEDKYKKKAESSLRGVLSAFSESGAASCAYVYPQTVNGMPGNYADPWANDQDWGLYYYLKNGEGDKK